MHIISAQSVSGFFLVVVYVENDSSVQVMSQAIFSDPYWECPQYVMIYMPVVNDFSGRSPIVSHIWCYDWM